MCSPAALFMMTAGGVGATGDIMAGREAYKAGMHNAALAEIEADDALRRGGEEETRYRRDLAQIAGTQRAAIGARNVTATGTALDMLEDTAMLGAEDITTIRNNAAREAFGLRSQAAESRRQARSLRRNSLVKAGSTLLTGGAQAYGIWKDR